MRQNPSAFSNPALIAVVAAMLPVVSACASCTLTSANTGSFLVVLECCASSDRRTRSSGICAAIIDRISLPLAASVITAIINVCQCAALVSLSVKQM